MKGISIVSVKHWILCVFMLISVQFMSYSQTEIRTEAQLRNIAGNLQGNYILMNDIVLSSEWLPVGSRETPFKGLFDGNGHVISNLRIKDPDGNQIGLFGVVSNGTILRTGIENAYIDAGSNESSGNDVGVFVGEGTAVTMKECYAAGFIVYGRAHVAGLIGGTKKAPLGNARNTIENCYATGTVVSRKYQAGGIIGTAENTDIKNCYFAGIAESVNSNTGGIISLSEGDVNTVSDCMALSPYLRGGTAGRIAARTGSGELRLINNYAHTGMLWGNSKIADMQVWQHTDTGTDKMNGKSIAADDSKNPGFYTHNLPSWDFENTWKLYSRENSADTGIYPVLAWQKAPVNVYLLGHPDESEPNIKYGDSYTMNVFGSHGQQVFAGSENHDIVYPVSASFSATDATTAFDAFYKCFYSPSRKLFSTYSSNTIIIAAIWTQAIYWDMIMNAYKRTRNDKYYRMIGDIYDGAYNRYDGFNWENKVEWFIYDDMMWWIISLARAYEITGDRKYLDHSVSGFDRVWRDSYDPLGSGMYWAFDHRGKTACINYPTVIGAMTLYNITKNRNYLSKAQEIYRWNRKILFDKNNGRVADHKVGSEPTNWTLHVYNQATCIGAAVMLYKETGLQEYLDDAVLAADCVRDIMSDENQVLPFETGIEQGIYTAIFAQYIIRLIEDCGQFQYLPWLYKNIKMGWARRDKTRNLTYKDYYNDCPTGRVEVYDTSGIPALMQVLLPEKQN